MCTRSESSGSQHVEPLRNPFFVNIQSCPVDGGLGKQADMVEKAGQSRTLSAGFRDFDLKGQ